MTERTYTVNAAAALAYRLIEGRAYTIIEGRRGGYAKIRDTVTGAPHYLIPPRILMPTAPPPSLVPDVASWTKASE